jgi:hypothetical protein
MTNGIDQVVALAGEVAELRQRLVQLDAERATIEREIADRVSRIAEAAVAAVTPAQPVPAAQPVQVSDEPMALSTAILYVIRRSPDTVFTAPEIARQLQMTDSDSAIRTHLARMAKDRRIARVSFGKYKAV